jgi:hypothetical protein
VIGNSTVQFPGNVAAGLALHVNRTFQILGATSFAG